MRQVFSSLYTPIFLPFLVSFFLLKFSAAEGQSPAPDSTGFSGKPVIIRSIRITGNKQTRPSVIYREMLFRVNDTLPRRTFLSFLKSSRDNIFNTHLFNFVTVDTAFTHSDFDLADVTIHVVERWYIWPLPYFEISDRNFNAWLQTLDFSRITYGADLTVYNARGRNETLILPVHFGYNRQFGFDYSIPYITKKKILGLGFGLGFDQNHEVIVESMNNKPVYYKDSKEFINQDLNSYVEFRVRPGIFSYHYLRISYNILMFSDSLAKIPGYSYDQRSYLQYFSLNYQFKNDHRDIAYYPLKGSYFDFFIVQNGYWNSVVNELYLKTNLRGYFHLYKRLYYAAGVTGKYTLTGQPPYCLQQGLGYGRELVRGYEYYVIDGEHFALFKNNLKFILVPPHVLNLGFIKTSKFNPVPYAFYLNLFMDLGYVYNSDKEMNTLNSLQNSLLLGWGIGVDFTTYYDLVVRVELSLTKEGVPGIYFHLNAPI
jgi:outer membrane protein assembly factor BamA